MFLNKNKQFFLYFILSALSLRNMRSNLAAQPLDFRKCTFSLLTSFPKTIDCLSTWPLFPLPSFRMPLRTTGHGQKNEKLAKVRSFSLVIFPCTRKPNRTHIFFSLNCSLQSLYILNEVTVDFTARCSEDQVRELSLQASLSLQTPVGPCRMVWVLLQFLWQYLPASFAPGGLIALCTRK